MRLTPERDVHAVIILYIASARVEIDSSSTVKDMVIDVEAEIDRSQRQVPYHSHKLLLSIQSSPSSTSHQSSPTCFPRRQCIYEAI